MPVTSGTADRFLLKNTAVGGQPWFHGMEAVMATLVTPTQPIVHRATNQDTQASNRPAQRRQSLASSAFGEYVTNKRDLAPLFATKFRRKTMMTAIKLGLVAFVLFAGAYVFETKAILDLESSDNWTQVYAP
jgi:hypothetical protein